MRTLMHPPNVAIRDIMMFPRLFPRISKNIALQPQCALPLNLAQYAFDISNIRLQKKER